MTSLAAMLCALLLGAPAEPGRSQQTVLVFDEGVVSTADHKQVQDSILSGLEAIGIDAVAGVSKTRSCGPECEAALRSGPDANGLVLVWVAATPTSVVLRLKAGEQSLSCLAPHQRLAEIAEQLGARVGARSADLHVKGQADVFLDGQRVTGATVSVAPGEHVLRTGGGSGTGGLALFRAIAGNAYEVTVPDMSDGVSTVLVPIVRLPASGHSIAIAPEPSNPPPLSSERSKKRSGWIWIVAGAVGAGTAAAFAFSSGRRSPGRETTVIDIGP